MLQRRVGGRARAHGVRSAQVLLTAAEIGDRRAYVNARNTFHELQRIGVVPVVNENDATATDEISFGDNDTLAAQVAILVRAQLLVLLTSVEGVLDARCARVIADGSAARSAVFGPASAAGKGGMESKVAAAELAAAAGIPSVIASGEPTPLPTVVAGGGTRFAAAATGESAFKLWLRFGKRVDGTARRGRGRRARRAPSAAAACSPSASSAARARSAPATASSSAAPTARRSGGGSARSTRRSSRRGPPTSRPCTVTG